MPISLLGFPAGNTGRMPWGSSAQLLPVPMGHWRCGPGWHRSGSEQAVSPPHTPITQTPLSSLGKTWRSTFARSQRNERRSGRSPAPRRILSSFAPYAKPACAALPSAGCPTFIPHTAQLKIRRDFQQGPCCELSERAGDAAAPAPAVAVLPAQFTPTPGTTQGEEKSQRAWENQCLSFPPFPKCPDVVLQGQNWRGRWDNLRSPCYCCCY